MDRQIAVLLELIDEQERSSRLVLDARASDERHRIQARRYLRSLDAFRRILRRHENDPAAQRVPEVAAVAMALGVGRQVPAS